MPIRPPPVTYACPSCNWSKTVTPRSDALMPGEVFFVCPKCGHSPLEQRPAGAVEGALVQLADRVRRLVK